MLHLIMMIYHPFFHQITLSQRPFCVLPATVILVSIIDISPLPLLSAHLSSCPPPGKSNPYCEVTMGAQIFTSRTLNDTLNPKWNFNCQFHIKDLYQDVLCITIFERDQFSPDGQLSSLFSSHFHVFHHPYSFTNIKIFFKGEKVFFLSLLHHKCLN